MLYNGFYLSGRGEMVDTQGLGPCDVTVMGVQVPPPAQDIKTMDKTEKQPTLTKKDDGTLELLLVLPWKEVEKAKEKIVANAVEHAELPGFRKGKAPRNMVEPTLDAGKITEEILRTLLPAAYTKAVEAENLRPIMNPKIQVEKIEDKTDWTITARTCEMPKIDLGNYKKAVQDVTAKSKIIVPGKEAAKPNMDEIIKALLSEAKITIPAILVEQEIDRILAQTLDEIKRLGLSLEQYLSSTGKTPETLREDAKKKAENDIKTEFAIQQVADSEKITVEDRELEEAFTKAGSPIERQQLEQNRYMLAGILRQQKTLDFLKNL